MSNTITIGEYTYHLSKAGARDGLRLLRAWCDVEAERQMALARMYDATGSQIAAQAHDLLEREPTKQEVATNAAYITGQMHRLQSADIQTKADQMLTDERIEALIIPTLGLAIVKIGDSLSPLVGQGGIWEAHFSGRLGELFELLNAIREHNFADFFSASIGSDEAEAEAVEPGPEKQAPSTGGSGRRSVRVSARSRK